MMNELVLLLLIPHPMNPAAIVHSMEIMLEGQQFTGIPMVVRTVLAAYAASGYVEMNGDDMVALTNAGRDYLKRCKWLQFASTKHAVLMAA